MTQQGPPLPHSRMEAKALGLKVYQSRRHCRFGHDGMGIQQGEQRATIAGNAGRLDEQTRFDAVASSRRTQRPSMLCTGLTIGGAAARTYGDFKTGQRPKPAAPGLAT